MPWESQPDFDALRDALRNEHQPATITEQLLVDGLAEHHWLRQRAITLQRDCFDPETGKMTDQKSFALYLRYETTHQRAFHKCLNDLLKLRAEKRKAEIGFESQRRQLQKHELAVLTAGAHLEFQLMENAEKYITEIRKDPAKHATYKEALTRNGFDQES